jgi:hypothetical protein
LTVLTKNGRLALALGFVAIAVWLLYIGLRIAERAP